MKFRSPLMVRFGSPHLSRQSADAVRSSAWILGSAWYIGISTSPDSPSEITQKHLTGRCTSCCSLPAMTAQLLQARRRLIACQIITSA